MNGVRLASYLTDKPFRYFDRIVVNTITPSFVENTDLKVDREFISRFHEGSIINPEGRFLLTFKMHPGLAMQSPGMHPFNGKVIVLIDGGTFSTAADFCAVLHHLKRATFVGEETGGGYSGNNSGLMTILTLPNSKVKVRLPMYSYWNAVIEGEGDRRGVRPNHLVESNLTDLMSGVDRQLDQAVRLATGSSVSK